MATRQPFQVMRVPTPLLLAPLCAAALLQPSVGNSASTIMPNRTVPKVEPPKTGLAFSTTPTVQEIYRARVFEVPLLPIGGEPSAEENAALAVALLGYAKRSGPDDFASLTGFLETFPRSPWRAALLAGLGFEYYTTAHYSLALESWNTALVLSKDNRNTDGSIILARAMEELALLYARLGRMTELDALLKSTGAQHAPGVSEKINMAREALWLMQNRPEVSFRCGPLALQSILRSHPQLRASCSTNAMTEIFNSASTQRGFSLSQLADLSQKVGLNYQMAFRLSSPVAAPRKSAAQVSSQQSAALSRGAATQATGDFIIPSVVHWKVGHYAAMVRQEGDRYLLEDPTFGNTVWATREALEKETSGYFLIPSGELPPGWRMVDAQEGSSVWGKGVTSGNDGDVCTPNDLQTGACPAVGMPVPSVHLMTANLSIIDTPLAYTPPVGPPVRFTVRHNSRDPYATEGIFGGYYWNGLTDTNIYTSIGQLPNPALFISPSTRMTHDWHSYIMDSPQSPSADVKWVVGGGGARTFKGFNSGSQTFAPNQYDETLLRRMSTSSYEMVWPDGSKKVFSQPDGSVGASRRVYLTQLVDPAGNALTFTYDQNLRIVAATDAIGQVTTLTYGGTNLADRLLTRVTDPFGRFATFEYEKRAIGILEGTLRVTIGNAVDYRPNIVNHEYYILTNMTDTLGLSSQPLVSDIGGAMLRMMTPYGTTTFMLSGGPPTTNNTRMAQIFYPDGSSERVEYNQTVGLVPSSDPPATFPSGMDTSFNNNQFLHGRNTFYWSRTAMASSPGNYSKARIYHWLHTENQALTSGVVESVKEPLERRVWFNYPGQEFTIEIGSSSRPTKVGRVLDDGTTQLYTYAYNGFGHITNSVDPVGRRFSYLYATNGIDLLEVRQTRVGNNELLARMTYNSQHQPLTMVGADGQTDKFTYNARGQRLTASNAKGETTTYSYDSDGYLLAVDGPLPGTNDTIRAAYDGFGRVRTVTSLSAYTVTFDYDAMDRVTRITYPDGTFEQFTYNRLDLVISRDRAGRQTFYEIDNMRQVKKQTDPLGRVTHFDWCRCGGMKSLTDPMGRTTSWLTDVQGRVTGKRYGDGSQVSYVYETGSSRLKHVIDEKDQVTQFTWNRDDTLRSIVYGNAVVSTPSVSFTYDPNYQRVTSMADGTGTTTYSYNPITSTPTLGAGALASVDGPLPDDTIAYAHDELGRVVFRAINGVGTAIGYDPAERLVGLTNVLGAFTFGYDGSSARLVSRSGPNGQTEERSYGNLLQDLLLQRITHRIGASAISEFLYGNDVAASRIATWSQQVEATPPSLHTFGYDAVNQLLSATVTNAGNLINTFAYGYDPAGNRKTESVGTSNYTATYNALNQIHTTSAPGSTRTNEWDALDRLVAVNVGNQRTEFTYDGLDRRVSIRLLTNGVEASFRRFVWCDDEICEERDASGAVTKRFYPEGVKVETGLNAGNYFYTRDHLGSIRELTDSSGNVRARYEYDPFGRRTKLAGDMESDFGFAGMFWSAEVNLFLTHFRAYDPQLGRWLSQDPLENAEIIEGPNLYAYVENDPINMIDPLGLLGAGGLHWTDEEWALYQALTGFKGEIVEVVPPPIPQPSPPTPRPMPPTPQPAPPTPGPTRPTPQRLPPQTPQNPRTPGPVARRPVVPGPSARPTMPAGSPLNTFIGAGITILTMTDCNTVEGIFALYRQGSGGMANKHADKLLKDLKRQKLL